MKTKYTFYSIILFSVMLSTQIHAQLPVVAGHPRIFLDPLTKTDLLTKKNTNDPAWLDLKADADAYSTSVVMTWNPNTTGVWGGQGFIFYNYCGSSWEDAAITLGMAHQLTKGNTVQPGGNPTAYSDKLLELGDSIVAAYANYPPGQGLPNIFLFNTSYATRHVGKTIGIIYDWCYDELSPARKAALINLMEDWFNYMRVPFNVYQLQDHPTGNYYFGHVNCAAYLGYALGSDSPLANQMIAFARQRILGTPSADLSPSDLSDNYFAQSYLGNLPSGASESYLGPDTYTGAPQKDGIPIQGWAYGGGTTETIIDYCFLVKSATGEIIADSLYPFFEKTAEAMVHSFTPNRFQFDNSNDNGSFVGSVASYSLPLRLSAVLEGTTAGPASAYFYQNWIQPVNLAAAWNVGYPVLTWENLLYAKTRTSQAFDYKPYYPLPEFNTYQTVPINSSIHKYYIRKDWSATSSWFTYDLGAAYYDDHAHNNAGHFKIIKGDGFDGDDILLVGANEVGGNGNFGDHNGIEGGTNYAYSSSLSNTLFIDDFDDYDPPFTNYINTIGGQTGIGYDVPTHEEQNDHFSLFRSDLTSSYYMSYYDPDTAQRSLKYYYRTFLFLRNSDIVLVYDNFQASNSSHALGQYKKHLRWHFLEEPTVIGNDITAEMGNSKLHIHTVIPAALDIVTINESANPDNTFGSTVDYIFNTTTWRAEVSASNNPLKQDILTVFQPGSLTDVEMTTSSFANLENTMEGTIVQVNGNYELVLFDKSVARYPVPIASASYNFSGPMTAYHTLCGMQPNGMYQVSQNGNTVVVTASPTGIVTASPSGVLRFQLSSLGTTELKSDHQIEVYPNPTQDILNIVAHVQVANEMKVEIYNAVGQLIEVKSFNASTVQLDLKNYREGIYLVHVFVGGQQQIVKLIKN